MWNSNTVVQRLVNGTTTLALLTIYDKKLPGLYRVYLHINAQHRISLLLKISQTVLEIYGRRINNRTIHREVYVSQRNDKNFIRSRILRVRSTSRELFISYANIRVIVNSTSRNMPQENIAVISGQLFWKSVMGKHSRKSFYTTANTMKYLH